MRDNAAYISRLMQVLGGSCFWAGIFGCIVALGVGAWELAAFVFGAGCVLGLFYVYAAECVTEFKRQEFVNVAYAGSFFLSCTLVLAPVACLLAISGTSYMRAYDVRWTFNQVRKGVPLECVLAMTPPAEQFDDDHDDFDDDLFNER